MVYFLDRNITVPLQCSYHNTHSKPNVTMDRSLSIDRHNLLLKGVQSSIHILFYCMCLMFSISSYICDKQQYIDPQSVNQHLWKRCYYGYSIFCGLFHRPTAVLEPSLFFFILNWLAVGAYSSQISRVELSTDRVVLSQWWLRTKELGSLCRPAVKLQNYTGLLGSFHNRLRGLPGITSSVGVCQ